MAYELFFDGFEVYGAVSEMTKSGYSQASGTISATGGRRASKGYLVGTTVLPITPSSHVVLAAAININSIYAGAVLELRNGTTVHASLGIIHGANPTLSVGGVSVGSAATIYPLATYMFVELGVKIGNAGVGTYEVRVNGSSVGWFPATVADTQNGATVAVDNIRLGISGSGSYVIDDLYTTFGDELVWLGDSRIDRLPLTANTATQDWTPSTGNAWERLNAGDGYVESNVDEATSLFEVADLSYSPLAIHGVKVGGLIKKSDAGYREACLLAKSNTTVVESTAVALSTDILALSNILKLDPATGLAWELPAIQAFQPGLRVKV